MKLQFVLLSKDGKELRNLTAAELEPEEMVVMLNDLGTTIENIIIAPELPTPELRLNLQYGTVADLFHYLASVADTPTD